MKAKEVKHPWWAAVVRVPTKEGYTWCVELKHDETKEKWHHFKNFDSDEDALTLAIRVAMSFAVPRPPHWQRLNVPREEWQRWAERTGRR